MFFFSLFSEAFRLLQSGFDFYVHSRLPLRKSRQGIWTEFLQLRYGAYTTFERLKIGKATEKLCSNSVAVLECFSVAIRSDKKGNDHKEQPTKAGFLLFLWEELGHLIRYIIIIA